MGFKKGNTANLKGRPKGSKNKYTQLRNDLLEAWVQSGGSRVLKNSLVRWKRDTFGKLVTDEKGNHIEEIDKDLLKIIVSILPRETKINLEAVHDVYLAGIIEKSIDNDFTDNNRLSCDSGN